MKTTPGEIRELFQRHNLRCTRQRELVYAALAETRSHPTAEELFTSVRAQDDGLSLATVYNTLEAMTGSGLCSRIPCATGAGPCRYDAMTSPHVHVTLADGRVVDVPEDLSERLLSHVPSDLLAEVGHRLGVRVGRLNVQVVESEPGRA